MTRHVNVVRPNVALAGPATPLPEPVVEASGYPAVIVAASDSSDDDKAKAGFVCTGTNDHVTINEAIQSLHATGKHFGGKVVLAAGTYQVSGTVHLYNTTATDNTESWGDLEVCGVGPATIIQLPVPVVGASFTAFEVVVAQAESFVPAAVRNLRFRQASAADIIAGQDTGTARALPMLIDTNVRGAQVTNCVFEGIGGVALYDTGEATVIANNVFLACGGSSQSTHSPSAGHFGYLRRAALLCGANGSSVTGNTFADCEHDVIRLEGANYCTVTGNAMRNGAYPANTAFIHEEWCNGNAISGNNGFYGGALYIAYGSEETVFSGNNCAENDDHTYNASVLIDASDSITLTNNSLQGVVVRASNYANIAGNTLWGTLNNAGARAVVFVTGNSSDASIRSNYFTRAVDEAVATLHAVALDAGTSDSWVAHNDMWNMWNVSAVSDAGTGNLVEGNRT